MFNAMSSRSHASCAERDCEFDEAESLRKAVDHASFDYFRGKVVSWATRLESALGTKNRGQLAVRGDAVALLSGKFGSICPDIFPAPLLRSNYRATV